MKLLSITAKVNLSYRSRSYSLQHQFQRLVPTASFGPQSGHARRSNSYALNKRRNTSSPGKLTPWPRAPHVGIAGRHKSKTHWNTSDFRQQSPTATGQISDPGEVPEESKLQRDSVREVTYDTRMTDYQSGTSNDSHAPTVLYRINKATKYLVTASAFCVLAYKHDAAVCWSLVGAVLNSFLCKVLKRIFNHSRPSTAVKEDPGMPSSHAQSIGYLATYAAAGLLGASIGSTLVTYCSSAVIQVLSVFLSWLRIKTGYHTTAQVLVGYVFGTMAALSWLWLWQSQAAAFFIATPGATLVLYTSTCMLGAAFCLMVFKPMKKLAKWRKAL